MFNLKKFTNQSQSCYNQKYFCDIQKAISNQPTNKSKELNKARHGQTEVFSIEKMLNGKFKNLKRLNKKLPNRETLNLQRRLLKLCKRFWWQNEDGVKWEHLIQTTVRMEFEQSKEERDPFILNMMQCNQRDAIYQLELKLDDVALKVKDHIAGTRNEVQARDQDELDRQLYKLTRSREFKQRQLIKEDLKQKGQEEVFIDDIDKQKEEKKILL